MNRPAMHKTDPDAVDHPPDTVTKQNISTEHHEEGDARRPFLRRRSALAAPPAGPAWADFS